MPPIDWLPWATPAFQRAHRAHQPVLLLLETAWSSPCRRFAREVLTRPDVEAAVAAHFVPVRVDVDWRPDIADRYDVGGWPALLALTPGGHVLGGGVPRTVDLAAWLVEAARLHRAHDGAWTAVGHDRTAAPLAVDAADAVGDLWSQLADAVDPASGAFGLDGQPVLGPALAALAGAASDTAPSLAEAAVRTVERLIACERWDPAAGLLRCRGATPWQAGESFARLDAQSEWVRLLAHAVACDPRGTWREALQAAVRGLRSAFATDRPHTWASWSGADRPATVFVDGTARACRGLLAAARVLDDAQAASAAIAAIEAVLPAVYTRQAGVAHVLTTRAHGPALLGDAMLVAHALLDADPWCAQPVYRDLAEELVRSACARLSHPSGSLLDRRHGMAGANDVGRLAQPMCPLEGNADAARACVRLGPHEADWRDRALGLLRGVHADGSTAQGFAAPLAHAWVAWLAPDHAISVW